MEKIHRDILVDLRTKIVDDLDVYNDIIHPLTTEYVLRNEDVEKIKRGQTKQRRAEILLDILPSCGPYAFDVFHQSMRVHYFWLSNEIDEILSSRRIDVTDIGRSVSPGSPNLPPQPSLNINREEKMEQLKRALEKIKPGGYLALHGMKGFGKSCLTANTLKDPALVKSLFANKVYWIKFGYERSIDDEILIQLNFLYHQVRNTDAMSTNVHAEPLKEQLIHALKNHFGKETNRNALLILDDVWSKSIIDAFDFYCKTLVITTDSDFLEGKQREIVEMKDGFTEAESLGLFAEVLKIEVSELPPEAKMIHEECNGMPILIAMFAAQFEEFKDDMKFNRERWKYYLDSLRTKDPTNKVIEQFLSKQEAIFDLCIDKLSPDAKSKYEALAIFSEDVNIMPETLVILWGGKKFNVEDQMVALCHKSLAAKHWNVDLKSYVYGVHDLLLCHLRKKLGSEKLRGLHASFIEKYREYCHNDFSKLPNDNYSYSYIGHHLEMAELYDEFPKLYLNFDFIREKIYQTGLSDLLIDLKKYRKFIILSDKEIESKVVDLEKFLENHAGIIAEQRRRKCLDLIQLGINYTSKKYVFKKTRELANAQSTKLFVTHDGPMFTLSPSDEIPTEARTAFFTNDPDKILIGNYSGRVILWDVKTRSQSVFSGHDEKTAIHKIIVSNEGNFFLTLCNHGEIRNFALKEDEHNGVIQSPREKQAFWSSSFRDKASRDNSQGKFFIEGEKITDMALSQKKKRKDRIGVCTDSGTIRVWTIDGNIIYTKNENEHSFSRITFTLEGSMLHLMNSEGVLKFYAEQIDSTTTSYSYVSTYNPKLQKPKVIFFQAVPHNDRSLLIVTENEAISVTWSIIPDPKHPNWIYQVHSFSKQSRAKVDDPETRFTSAALTYDGLYLITADSKGTINVWKVESGTEPIGTFNGRVDSLDTYWEGEEFHLICGCGKNVIYRWVLALEELPKSVRKPLFDAVMNPWGKDNIIAKEAHTNANATTVNLYRGDTMVARTEPVDGTITRLSLNSTGDKIIYTTDKWVITLFDVATMKSTTILKLTTAPSIVTFVSVGGSTTIVCGENNNLKVWFGKVQAFVENTGNVTSIYTIEDEYVATVARNGTIIFWRVHDTNWVRINALTCCAENENLCYSSLNTKENLLAVLKVNGEMIIHEIVKDDRVNPPNVGTSEYAKHLFNQKLTCCEFSQDDNYLAIGLENGDISIFDITGRCELNRLQLHCNEVRELHWSPNSIGAPILLSVNCNELAWWNVSMLLNEKKKNRRSRMGMSRSTSSLGFSPRSSIRMTSSQSMDSEVANTIARQFQSLEIRSTNGKGESNQNGGIRRENGGDGGKNGDVRGENGGVSEKNGGENGHFNPETYWRTKTAKGSNRKALLSVVPLPPSCNSKVCVSSDFSKFLSIDIHGIVSIFKFYNYDAL